MTDTQIHVAFAFVRKIVKAESDFETSKLMPCPKSVGSVEYNRFKSRVRELEQRSDRAWHDLRKFLEECI